MAWHVERMGTGIQDMVKLCIKYGLPEPDFKTTDVCVTTHFRKDKVAFERIGGEVLKDKVVEKGKKKARKRQGNNRINDCKSTYKHE